MRRRCGEAHAIAKDHGWWDATESPPKAPSYSTDSHRSPQSGRTFGEGIADIHESLSEARKAYREDGDTDAHWRWHDHNGKEVRRPEGVPMELADVVIRVADMAEQYGCNLEAAETIDPSTESFYAHLVSFGDWIEACGIWLSFAFLEKLLAPDFHPARPLAPTLLWVQEMAAHYGIDLDAAIEAKMEYNRTREYRHGGKAL